MPEFLNCPFCGETKSFEVFAVFSSSQPDGLRVECGTCGAQGPTGEDRDQAIANWNRRPTSTLTGDGPYPGVRLKTDSSLAEDEFAIESGGKRTLFNLDGSRKVPATDELAQARERRELAGLPSVNVTAEPDGIAMDFDLGGPGKKR